MQELIARCDSGKTWTYRPFIRNHPSGFRTLVINPPIEYRLEEDFLEKLQMCAEKDDVAARLHIDIGGRLHGVKGPVYIPCADIVKWLKENTDVLEERN